jgi:hypothetical protein
VRTVVLAVALAFVVVLAALTLYVLVSRGPDVLVVLSLVVVAVLAYGVLGEAGEPRR